MNKLLERQLAKFKLDPTKTPTDAVAWAEFLQRVSAAYEDAENERYLLERSMEVSSRELLNLNDKLENAQRIAKMGYWFYDEHQDRILMSLGLRELFGSIENTPPSRQEFLEMVYDADREKLASIKQNSKGKNEDTTLEFRKLHPTLGLRWYHMVHRPFYDPETGAYQSSGVIMDITDRKQAEEELSNLNDQLLITARHAGMADIATSILHNVGNVLNSVVVSMDMLKEHLANSKIKQFADLSKLLNDNIDNIQDYLHNDPKGKLLPQYLTALSEKVMQGHSSCTDEVENLVKLIQHIKDIIASQNDLSSTKGMVENVEISKMLDSAIKMAGSAYKSQKNIRIMQCLGIDHKITIDQVKVLQILVNLIQNAKESLALNDNVNEKLINIHVKEIANKDEFKIIVEDNGEGIDEEALKQLFTFGFTTKKTGHGFGLHASALAAKEMGGSLIAKSDGKGKGASFILTLPLKIVA